MSRSLSRTSRWCASSRPATSWPSHVNGGARAMETVRGRRQRVEDLVGASCRRATGFRVVDDDGGALARSIAKPCSQCLTATGSGAPMTARPTTSSRRLRWDPGLIWLPVLVFTVFCLALKRRIALAGRLSRRTGSCRSRLGSMPVSDASSPASFNRCSAAFLGCSSSPMRGVQAVLHWIPWPVMMVLVGAVALRAGGRRLAVFALATLALSADRRLLAAEHEHLALVLLAVPISAVLGFALGVLGHRREAAARPSSMSRST